MIRLKGERGLTILVAGPTVGKSSFALWHIMQHLFAKSETVLVEPEATNDFFKKRLEEARAPKPFVLRAAMPTSPLREYTPPEPKHHNTHSFKPRNKRRSRMQKQSRKINRNN